MFKNLKIENDLLKQVQENFSDWYKLEWFINNDSKISFGRRLDSIND